MRLAKHKFVPLRVLLRFDQTGVSRITDSPTAHVFTTVGEKVSQPILASESLGAHNSRRARRQQQIQPDLQTTSITTSSTYDPSQAPSNVAQSIENSIGSIAHVLTPSTCLVNLAISPRLHEKSILPQSWIWRSSERCSRLRVLVSLTLCGALGRVLAVKALWLLWGSEVHS